MVEGCSEKFARRLIGRTEVEDALKKLDRLTQEEVRMTTAQNLKATHTVVGTVTAIDNRVASVDDKVAEAVSGA